MRRGPGPRRFDRRRRAWRGPLVGPTLRPHAPREPGTRASRLRSAWTWGADLEPAADHLTKKARSTDRIAIGQQREAADQPRASPRPGRGHRRERDRGPERGSLRCSGSRRGTGRPSPSRWPPGSDRRTLRDAGRWSGTEIRVLQGPTVLSRVTANSSLQSWVETGSPPISVTVQLAAAG